MVIRSVAHWQRWLGGLGELGLYFDFRFRFNNFLGTKGPKWSEKGLGWLGGAAVIGVMSL
jgi:hypothetical protein